MNAQLKGLFAKGGHLAETREPRIARSAPRRFSPTSAAMQRRREGENPR